jgi:hypothetical protein
MLGMADSLHQCPRVAGGACPDSGARLRHGTCRPGASRRPTIALLATAALAAVAGCGSGPGGTTRQVASIPSASHPVATHAQPAGTGPASQAGVLVVPWEPLKGLHAYQAWGACLKEHHPTQGKRSGQELFGIPDVSVAAAQACRSLQPHGPWQEDPTKNPRYKLDFAHWINCLNARGVHVVATQGGVTAGGWTYTSSHVPPNDDQIELQCEMRAFGEHR